MRFISKLLQHISGSFRQDEFKDESAQAVPKIREHRRVLKNSLVSSFLKYAVPKTLFARFMLIIIIPILIGQILAIFLFYDRHWYNVSYYTSTIIINEMESLIKEYKDSDRKKAQLEENYLSLSYQFQPNAKLPAKQPKLNESLEIFKNILNTKITEKNIVKLNNDNKIEASFQLAHGILQITFPAKLLLNPTVYIFVLWLIFLTIILLTVSIIFSKNQIKSILALADAADEFGQGILNSKNFKPSGASEIRKAGLAFLKMKNRIEKQITKRTNMLAMISHDLRTPLTRMKLQLELMEASEETEGLKIDILTMQQMINSYLDFAKGENAEEFKTVVIVDSIASFLNKWSHIDIELINLGNIDNIKVKIKASSFERALSNLISNAIKYSTKIKISVQSNSSLVTIKIEDNGTGISDKEKPFVFKPFYRSDKARHLDDSGSVGLGLAITREIILDHKGVISLEDSKTLGGLAVRIELPLCKAL
ncbi:MULTISPECIES: ATP-binding protein [unclassified Rickettsia]|uniref:ATP-binding protein n=1 Tax=unclassified Rickettsia TaxID=114295 RepID=UPI00313322C3